MLSITRFIPGWATTVHTVLLATLMFTITLDVNAQASRETTTRTIAKPANDASLAIGANGIAYVAFTTTKVDGDTVSVTGVKAARCDDIACSSKSTFIEDEAGLGSPKFALDSSGLPIVVYVRQGDDSEEVWQARCETSGCRGVAYTFIAEGQGPLDFAVGANDNAVVAFQQGDELRLAWCSNASCDFTSISVISMQGGNPSLALNTAGNPVISYKSRNPRRTKIAVCADEACAAIANLAEIPRTDFGRTTSIDIDSNDNPVLAVDDADGGIKVARCDDPLCETFTVRGRDSLGAGSVSMALDEFDNPVIFTVTDAVNMLKCTDSLCENTPIFRKFTSDAESYSLDSPTFAFDEDGRPIIVYEASDNRVRLISCGDPLCGASGLENRAVYHLQNVATGEYLDPLVSGSVGMASAATKRTRFYLRRLRTGVYLLLLADFQTFLDAQGTTLSQSFNARRDDQWRLQINNDGSHTIRSVASGSTMTVDDGEPQLVPNPGPNDQDRWQFVLADTDFDRLPLLGQQVALQNVATGRWLDADGNSAVNQSRNRRADDVWRIFSADLDYTYLRNEAFERYLDADRNNTLARTSANPGIDDRWDLIEVESGVFTLRNVRFGRYLAASETPQVFDVETVSDVSPNSLWRIAPID